MISRRPRLATRVLLFSLGLTTLGAGSALASEPDDSLVPEALSLSGAAFPVVEITSDGVSLSAYPEDGPETLYVVEQAGVPVTDVTPHIVRTEDSIVSDAVVLQVVEVTGAGAVTISADLADVDVHDEAAQQDIVIDVVEPHPLTWTFAEPGEYAVTLAASTIDDVGVTRESGTGTFHFVVVPSGEDARDDSPDRADESPAEDSEHGTPDEPHRGDAADDSEETREERSSAPSRVTDDPEEFVVASVEDPEAPTELLSAPDVSLLTDANRGGVDIGTEQAVPGSTLTLTVPSEYTTRWISVWLGASERDLGWKQVTDDGQVLVPIPDDVPLGDDSLVVRDRTAALVGWAPVQIAEPDVAQEQCVATPVTRTVSRGDVGVVTSGHLDFGPVMEGGSMRALYKDDRQVPAQWVDPGSLVLHLDDSAAVEAPGGAFDFLGTGTVWQIPLTQSPTVPWLGWNTQHPTIAGQTQGDITLTLEAIDGPGQLAVYSLDSFGGVGARYFGTVDGFPRSTAIPVGDSGVHVHGIWAFTEPGPYVLSLSLSGTVAGQQHSAAADLAVFVGAGDPRAAVREQTVTEYVGRTASGDECTLTLAQTGVFTNAADLPGLAGTLIVVGLAFLGASALAPRRSEPAAHRHALTA